MTFGESDAPFYFSTFKYFNDACRTNICPRFSKGIGSSAKRDFATAFKEWKPLAELGDSGAQHNLGVMYFDGLRLPQDYKKAVRLYTIAVEQGHASAQFNLGVIYELGQGVLQDYREAVKWYTLAAEQGSGEAQGNLGAMYYNGKGVLADLVMAHMWLNIAAANGNELSAKNKKIVAENLTSEDISKAQAMARVCMNSNFGNCGF